MTLRSRDQDPSWASPSFGACRPSGAEEGLSHAQATVGVVIVVGLTVFCVTGGLMTLVINRRPVDMCWMHEVFVVDRGRLGAQHSVRTPGGRSRSERRDDRE
jgi:hypothetical protein